MKWNEYQDLLRTEIDKSSEEQKMHFAISICEKLLPDYNNFVLETNWGNQTIMIKAFELIKKNLIGEPTQIELIKEISKEVENNIPNTENFGQISGSLALNSSLAIFEALNFILDKKADRILDLGNLSYDSVYFTISALKPELTDLELENEKDLKNEVKWQFEKIKYVA